MDWQQFTIALLKIAAELTSAAVWPALIFWLIRTYGDEIKRRIPDLKTFKAGPVELSFKEELAMLPEIDLIDAPSIIDAEEAKSSSPFEIIASAWAQVENAIVEHYSPDSTLLSAIKNHHKLGFGDGNITNEQIVDWSISSRYSKLPPHLTSMIAELRKLRERASSRNELLEISLGDALTYERHALQLVAILKGQGGEDFLATVARTQELADMSIGLKSS